MTAPFIIYALPRSRTAWLSRFLTYGDWTCEHESARHVRGPEDVRSWLSQDCVGTAETAGVRWWRLVRHYRPEVRVVVVRRPVSDVVESVLRLDMRGVCSYDRDNLTQSMRKFDGCLDRIEQETPSVVSVTFADLASEQVCANIFEHCLPYNHDTAWWGGLANENVQINMPALIRHYFAHRRQIERGAAACFKELRKAVAGRWRGSNEAPHPANVTLQVEPLDIFWRDGQALFAEHHAEVGDREGVALSPNIPLAQRLERGGALQVLTARVGGRMVGYLATIVSPSLENADFTTAMQNTFFVSKEHRGLGPRLQRESLEMLRERGVDEVIFRAGVRGAGAKLSALYQRLGAEDYGRLYRLGLKAA